MSEKKSIARIDNPYEEIRELANSLKDYKYLRNEKIIRQKLIIYLSSPKKKRPSLKNFCKREGISYKVARKLVNTKEFRKELSEYIRKNILSPAVVRKASEELVKAVSQGRGWAVRLVLKEAGIIEKKKEEDKQVPYDKLILHIHHSSNDNKKDVIDLERGEDYEIK